MARTDNTAPADTADTAEKKARKPRSAPKAKKLFVVLTVKNEDGSVMEIPKDRVEAHVGTYSAEEALEVMEGTPGSFYKSFTMKPARGGAQAEQA